MKRGKTLLAFCAVVVFIAAACSRGGEVDDGPHIINANDTTLPLIEIYHPLDDQFFRSGDTIRVEGKVTDNSLYRGSIRITNDANGAVIKEQLYEIHGFTQYNFSLAHKTAVTAAADYTVTVQYEDHGYNNAVKTVKVKVNP